MSLENKYKANGTALDLSIEALPFKKITAMDAGKPFDQFFKDLHESTTADKKRGRAKRNEFKLWTKPDTSIYGWKFNEWDYGKSTIELPSNARGLFSIVEDGKERIVVRGYDKFFNINEVPETKWEWIEQNTKGPYEVTSKENGCIVFIAGLEDGTLIVTSKQSTGPRDSPNEKNHSWVGQQWVERHLAKKNVSVPEFAKLLHSMGATAVGELCDDDFEEHVLAYPGDKAGIYLHGLNLNVAKFNTYPFSSIEQFAERFGFHTTEYLVIDTLPELRKFLETCAETGSWNGVEVEGFVIRSKAKMKSTDELYSDFFFKYKFEEPYLMYRQWREMSRAYLSGKSRDEIRIHKHQEISKRYLDYVIPLFDKSASLRQEYNQSHGIIGLREQFLKTLGKTGADILQEESITAESVQKPKKYVLVPISTIGCGKTTVAVALTQLFPSWGHFQNDDLGTGSKPQRLVQRCVDYLSVDDVVILDRNNHQFRERTQVFTDFPKLTKFGGREYVYICLNFDPFASKDSKTWDLTTARVMKRGDNHQSIYASSESGKVTGIMTGFKNRYQPFDARKSPDNEFDFEIKLDSTKENSSRLNLETVVKALHTKYPEIVPEMISKEKLDAAYEFALSYKPKSTGPSQSHYEKEQRKPMKPQYFGIEIDFPGSAATQQTKLIDLIDKFFDNNPKIVRPPVWAKLKEDERVQVGFHVTLVHLKQGGPQCSDETAKAAFTQYNNLFKTAAASAPPMELQPKAAPQVSKDGFTAVEKKKKAVHVPVPLGQTADVELKMLAWNTDLMVLEVGLVSGGDSPLVCMNKVPHITVGTRDRSVLAVRAGQALESALKGQGELVKAAWNIEPKVLKDQMLTAYS